MGFTNVFVADLKAKVFDFAKEEMDLDSHTENTIPSDYNNDKINDPNLDIATIAHDSKITQNQNETLPLFKQRVLDLYRKRHPYTLNSFKSKFPSNYAGDNEHFFGPDPTDLITFLNPAPFPNIITKKTRMMMRHGELFFDTLTAQMKILNGITQS